MFLHILRDSPHLAELECAPEKAILSTPDAHIPETFTSLSYLTLRGDLSVFNSVRFPSLCRLGLHDIFYRGEPDSLEIVMSFISRSSCVISHLVLGLYVCNEEEFADWLEAFPSLKALEIQTDLDLDYLIPCLSAASVSPELRDLKIRSLESNVDYNVLIEMLQQRRHPMNAVKLQSFHLDLCDFREEDEPPHSWPPPNLAASELKRMMVDGLRFVLILSPSGVEAESWPDPSVGKSVRCSQGPHGTDLVHSQKVGLALRYVT
jgi:hypothetical protein